MRYSRVLSGLALACASVLTALPASAQQAHLPFCAEDGWKKLGVGLGYTRLHEEIEDQWARCEVRPNDPNRAIIAFAFPAKGIPVPQSPLEPLVSYDLEVLLVDTKTLKVLSRDSLHRPKAADGSGLTGVELDPAQRVLQKGVRSIGVRLQHAQPSQKKFDSLEQLSIYAIEGDKLRKVLDRFPSWTVVGEWDERCDGAFLETRKQVRAAPVRGSAFADLTVRVTEDSRSSKMKGTNCVESKKKPVQRNVTLRYEGDRYVEVAPKKAKSG